MAMFVDRRKDNYDELLVLANDARTRRTRNSRWSIAAIAAAIVGTGLYIASVSQQVDSIRDDAKKAAEGQKAAEGERDRLQAEIDALMRYQDFYADVAPAQSISNSLGRIALRLGDLNTGTPNPGDDTDPGTGSDSRIDAQFAINSMVWIVDGSRRFPMTAGDILWVPEGQFWLQLGPALDANYDPIPGVKPNRITINKDASPPQVGARSASHSFGDGGEGTDFEVSVDGPEGRGSANCIRLTWHAKSNRAGFGNTRYIDMEVLYYNNNECPSRL